MKSELQNLEIMVNNCLKSSDLTLSADIIVNTFNDGLEVNLPIPKAVQVFRRCFNCWKSSLRLPDYIIQTVI